MTAVEFRIVRDALEFRALRPAWQTLFSNAQCATAALSSAAIEAFLSHSVGAQERAVVVVAHIGERLIGALPLISRPHLGGVVLSSFDDTQTYGVEFLIDRSAAEAETLRERLLTFVMQALPGVFAIRLLDVPEHSPTLAAIRRVPGWLTHRDVRRYASYLSIPSPDQDITAVVSSNFRKNLRKQEARLRSMPDVAFTVVDSALAGPAHTEMFLELEAAGWKGAIGTAISSRAATNSYYHTLVSELANDGLLEWHFLHAGDKLIAAQLGVRTDDVLTLLKIAYDETAAAVAPGNMLFLETVRRETRDRRSCELNCLTDMPWHRNWKMASRQHVTVTLFRARAVPVLFGFVPVIFADALRRSATLRRMGRAVRRLAQRPSQ